MFGTAGPGSGVALVALGGYGRSELGPASDVDLLILHDGAQGEAAGELAERLLYPMWDAGFTVGHAVRTPDECPLIAAERLDAMTAMLDARLLAGDSDLWEAARERLLGLVREDPGGFAGRLREGAARRGERHGFVSHLLEPDLKEGVGGLRDAHSLGWLAVAVGGRPDQSALEAAGLLRAAEREAVDAAAEFLVRVRSALQLETARRADRLYLDQQQAVARSMGFEDEPGLPAVDGLMRAVFEHARQVAHVVGAVFDRYLRGESGFEGSHETPEDVLRAFADNARERRVLPTALLDRVEAMPLPDPIPWSSGVRDAFLAIVRAGDEGVRALEAMDRVDLLGKLLPEWRPVRCRPQRDPYHRYSVDVHLLETLRGIGRLLPGSDNADGTAIDRVALEAAAAVGDPDALFLGALLHDIGKTGAGNHVPVGARVAASALGRMGLPAHTRDLAQFMVEHHLLLSDTATRRDLEDDDLVLDVAAKVGDPERLAALYLLAAADAEATGPLAWTPWRATLVRELVAKVQRVLERGDMGPELAERIAERSAEVRARLAGVQQDAVARFLARMPRSYVATVPPEQAAAHFHLMTPPGVGSLEVRTSAGSGAQLGTYTLTVVAADRPGLLSSIAGALSLAGLSILTAQVFTTEDGVALDVFEVEGVFEQDVGEERWREFRGTLRKVLEGRIALAYRVAEKRKHYPAPRAGIPVEVTVNNDASDFFTVIEVGAPDRIGLLFDITRTLADLRLDVHLAKVATYGERVVDAFYVRDVLGRKVGDADHVAEIEGALAARVAG